MPGLLGADVEALERLAADVDRGAQELRELSAQVAGAIEGARDWHGPDAVRCKEEWGTFAQQRMTGVADALSTASRLLAQNAQEQERASGAESVAAPAATYGLMRFIDDVKALWSTVKKPLNAFTKAKALLAFVNAIRAAGLPAAATSVKVAEALRVLTHGSAPGWLATKLGLGGVMRTAGKAFLPITLATGLWDGITGGNQEGWHKVATHGFGLAGAAGAGVLLASGAGLIAAAPVTLAVAGGAVVAYGAWSAYTTVRDNWGTITDRVGRVTSAIGDSATRAWQGVSSGYEQAIGWARGLLGGPRTAGAGA
jgi:uncharacterized protein YukE